MAADIYISGFDHFSEYDIGCQFFFGGVFVRDGVDAERAGVEPIDSVWGICGFLLLPSVTD